MPKSEYLIPHDTHFRSCNCRQIFRFRQHYCCNVLVININIIETPIQDYNAYYESSGIQCSMPLISISVAKKYHDTYQQNSITIKYPVLNNALHSLYLIRGIKQELNKIGPNICKTDLSGQNSKSWIYNKPTIIENQIIQK